MTDFQTIQFELDLNSCVRIRYAGESRVAYLVAVSPCGENATFAVNVGHGEYVPYTVSADVVRLRAFQGRPIITHIFYGGSCAWNAFNTNARVWKKFQYYVN